MTWMLVLDIVTALAAALAAGLLCERIGISSIAGYLLAGLIVGPGALKLIEGGAEISLLAEIGVALLLFTIGLEFSWRQMRALGSRTLFAGLLSIVLITLVTAGVALGFGLTFAGAISVGAVLSLGSTAVVLRILRDRAELDHVHGRRALGVLLLQDAALVPLVLLVTFLSQNTGSVANEVGKAVINTGVLTLGLVGFVSFVVPRILDEKAVARNRELVILLGITTCVGATWAAHDLKLSPALGAFVAGMLLADNRFADQLRADVMPLRTLFVTLFFVSVGLLADLQWIGAHLGWVLLASVAVIAGKILITHISLRAFLPGIVDSLATAITLAQVGEFSFVLAGIARTGGSISEPVFQGVVAVSLVTLLITPFMVPRAPKLARSVAKRLMPLRALAKREREQQATMRLSGHILVIGYGESGEAAVKVLRELGHRPVVLDMGPREVTKAEQCGHPSFIGDARSADILEHVHLSEALGVIVSIPDFGASRVVVGQCKRLAPHVPVIARARYHQFAAELDVAGADIVADEEILVGAALAHRLVAQLPEVKPEPKTEAAS